VSDFSDLAQKLTTGCRILAEQQIIDAYGHFSARLPGAEGRFVISRGMSPALVQPEDFIVLDFEGNVVEGKGFPNAEWPIHACVYRARPDVQSVLHSHARLSRIFSLSPVKLRGMLLQQSNEWFDGLPIYEKPGLINSIERGDALAATLGQGSAALLRGHGDVVIGRDVTATAMRAITLRDNADILNEVLSHGEPHYWSREEATDWTAPLHGNLSPEASAALANRLYDYFVARVDGRLSALLQGDRQ